MYSEINHFGAFLRSVIEAKNASHPFLDWKVGIVAILSNTLISIKVMLGAVGASWSTV